MPTVAERFKLLRSLQPSLEVRYLPFVTFLCSLTSTSLVRCWFHHVVAAAQSVECSFHRSSQQFIRVQSTFFNLKCDAACLRALLSPPTFVVSSAHSTATFWAGIFRAYFDAACLQSLLSPTTFVAPSSTKF